MKNGDREQVIHDVRGLSNAIVDKSPLTHVCVLFCPLVTRVRKSVCMNVAGIRVRTAQVTVHPQMFVTRIVTV